jgi:uncharacterized protein HemX
MFKNTKNKLGSLVSAAREKAAKGSRTPAPVHRLIRDNKGNSEMVAVVVLIVVVLVIGAVVFLPGLKDYFQNTVSPGMKTATENIFNFKG